MNNPHVGSRLTNFWPKMTAQKLTKTAMAKKMRTSRATLNRLLDATDTSLTLTTLASAALGRQVSFDLRAA